MQSLSETFTLLEFDFAEAESYNKVTEMYIGILHVTEVQGKMSFYDRALAPKYNVFHHERKFHL